MAASDFTPLAWLSRHRRRIAPLLLVACALTLGDLLLGETPREQRIEYRLSPSQQRARTVAITYVEEGEAVLGVRFNYPDQAPSRVVHTPSLRPGRYNVAIHLEMPDAPNQHIDRPLEVPFEGTLRIALSDRP